MTDDLVLADDQPLAIRAFDSYGAEIERAWSAARGEGKPRSDFLEKGYFGFAIPPQVAAALMGFFDERLARPFERRDVHPAFFSLDLGEDVVARLNRDNIYYAPPSPQTQQALAGFLQEIASPIELQLAQRWRVVNVRAWEAQPNSAFGPSAWHADGGPCFLRKMLLYPVAPNAHSGSVEFTDRTGNRFLLQNESPAGILYDSSVLQHRGRPGEAAPRPIIEITIAPADKTDVTFQYAGQNAYFPRAVPRRLAEPLARSRYASQPSALQYGQGAETETTNQIANLNLGGGPRFRHRGWVNLEGAPGPDNLIPFSFGAGCTFPLPASAVRLVYSSHCLEHLDDATVDRVLQECRRVLGPQAKLLLKLPDFELVRRAWAQKNAAFFGGGEWALDGLAPLWRVNGVEDSLTNRAAMIFCGYWNQAYGDHFSRAITLREGAYHGPPKMPRQDLERLLATASPHAISRELAQFVRGAEPAPAFNHQNAWSSEELAQLLARNGFAVESTDAAALCSHYSRVPGILEMKAISIYCVASAR